MLARFTPDGPEKYVRVCRTVKNTDVSRRSAFSKSETMELTLRISRILGVCVAVLSLKNDKTGQVTEMPLELCETEKDTDLYSVSLNFAALCGDMPHGLFFFDILLCRGDEKLYLNPVNNIDFTLSATEPETPFALLVYADGYQTPAWAKNAVMYHIFVDRFAKSEKHTLPVRADAHINPDWDNGIPEYAPYPGAHIQNNEFFGGSLYGIIEKLDYLVSLGVNVLYLSPIFKAYSNHKYDTGDYAEIDEMFGEKEAFDELLCEAKKRGMHIILDGVFNHTGDDSRYFNRYGHYDTIGAYQSPDSPYHEWYYFRHFPEDYECWWGIKILPKLNNTNPTTRDYFLGENGILRRYVAKGTSGWRLDVADELPDAFLTDLRGAVKKENPDALILGEVWENAAVKIAYGARRSYLLGFQLDSVMNYPFKNAILDYVRSGDCTSFYNTVTEIISLYPPQTVAVLMNLLGTHDTERILTALGADPADFSRSNEQKASFRLSPEKREHAEQLLKFASTLQFTLPGMPSVFYGDEAGMEGFGDPFCRRPYPWGREAVSLRAHYAELARLKRNLAVLHTPHIAFVVHNGAKLGFVRYSDRASDGALLVLCNAAKKETVFDESFIKNGIYKPLYGVSETLSDGSIVLAAESAVLLFADVFTPSDDAILL